MSFDLDQRTGWPEELLGLLKQFPRETWRVHTSPVAQFWLERHDAFRREAETLEAMTNEYRAERVATREFAVKSAPRLQNMLGHLHGHHQIEDFHYFPHFRTAEPRLERGFETLEKDHRTLHEGIEQVVETFNALAAALGEQPGADLDAQRRAGERYVEASLLLYRRLARHLDDEEDLIIPLMLDRG